MRDKIPLRVCLYVSTALRTLKVPFARGQSFAFRAGSPGALLLPGDMFIGDLLLRNSEVVAANLFQRVVLVDPTTGSSASAGRSCDVIVTPELVKYESRYEMHPLESNVFFAQATMRWTVVSPDGKEIYTSPVNGEGTALHKPANTRYAETNMECTLRALTDHFQNAQADLYSNAWWKTQWWKDAK
jgi:hypothetical protein